MAVIDSKTVQQLLDQIGVLKAAIEDIGEAGRTKLSDIKTTEVTVMQNIPTSTTGKVDESKWSIKNEKDQGTSYNRLVHIRDSLRSASGLDGPSDEGHLMYGGYASNFFIVAWLLLSLVFVGALLIGIVLQWSQATSTDYLSKIQEAEVVINDLETAKGDETRAIVAEAAARKASLQANNDPSKMEAQKELAAKSMELDKKRAEVELAQQKANTQAIEAIRTGGASEQVVLVMVILLGALGGSLHLVGSLVMYIGNGQLKRRWLPYYLSLPAAGAALAPIVYMLLRVGILTPSGISNGGTGTSNLNLVGIYAFAALTGLFAKTATDKLSEVFATLFRTGEHAGKDKIGSGPAPGGNPSQV